MNLFKNTTLENPILKAIEELDFIEQTPVQNKIIPYLNENTIVTSNTSGLSLSDLSKDLPDPFLKNFFISVVCFAKRSISQFKGG